MKTITIRWELTPEDPPRAVYFLDDSPVGEDDAGFNKILDVIRAHEKIRVTLKIGRALSLGGKSLRDSFPFRERYDELSEALGDNKLIIEFS